MPSIAWRSALALSLAVVAAPGLACAAPARLTEPTVRAFVAAQERAWNRKDLAGYFAGFTRHAVFVDQARTPKGETIRYGSSDLATAKAQSKRYFARARFTDRGAIDSITIAPDGRSARVLGHRVSRVETRGRVQTLCARTDRTLVLIGGQVRSRGQTDTAVRCQSAGPPTR